MTHPIVRTLTVITKMPISEVSECRQREGSVFLDAAFSSHEQATCLKRRRPDHGLAARYAAREGLRRACEELGLRPPSSPAEAEVIHDAFGAPRFRLSGDFCHELRHHELNLSLAHDGNLACAILVVQSALNGD